MRITPIGKTAATLLLGCALLRAQSPPLELKVRLTAPLTTKLSRAGDLVTAKILQPPEYAGGYLEGDVREVHTGSSTKRSAIYFDFHSLHAAGKESHVSVGVVRIANSKHQADTDEDGAGIEEERGGGSFGGLTKLRSGVMSRISKGGEKTAPAAAPAVLTRLTAKAPNLSLAVGSEMTVQFIVPASK
jgi:hypothetical protein